jgi:hypothetical protein
LPAPADGWPPADAVVVSDGAVWRVVAGGCVATSGIDVGFEGGEVGNDWLWPAAEAVTLPCESTTRETTTTRRMITGGGASVGTGTSVATASSTTGATAAVSGLAAVH